jgi:hypothetical protein
MKDIPNHHEVSLWSICKAYPASPRPRSQPRDHPVKITKNEPKAYRGKRSPLTLHTFESPFSRQETSELLPFSLDAEGSVDTTYEEANLINLAGMATTQAEMEDVDYLGGASLTVADSTCSVREPPLEPRSITPPPKVSLTHF